MAGTSCRVAGRISLIVRAYRRPPDSRPPTTGTGPVSEPVHVRHPDHGGSRGIGLRQVDLRRDAPVVVACRVVEYLADFPHAAFLTDDEQARAARIRSGPDVVVFVE